ncbi:hypothetical protein [Actinomadura meridiana]
MSGMNAARIRLMTEDDLHDAERASTVTFLDSDRLAMRVGDPEPEPPTPDVSRRWIDRMRFFLTVDPEGCWVAEDNDDNDLEWMDRLDADLRGAGHGPDHRYMLNTLRLVVHDSRDRPGYVYINDTAGWAPLLAAAHPETARLLLWEALASTQDETLVNCITTPNHWAVDVGLAARLHLA